MSKDPAFLFYYKDFMHGTRYMTRQERGLYIELLCEQADSETGSISKDHMNIICKTSENQVVLNKFKIDDNGYYNEVLRDHLDKRRSFIKSRSDNRKGKKKKKNISKTHDKLVVNVNENVNKDIKIKYAEFVKMKEAEYNQLIEKHGEVKTKKFIEVLDNYKGSKGKTYKSDYRAILSWVVDKCNNGQIKSDHPNYYSKEYERKLSQQQTREYHKHLLELGYTKTYLPTAGTIWHKPKEK